MKKAKRLDYPPVELADCFNKDRDGRPRKQIDEKLRQFILQELKLNPGLSTSQLRRMVERKADDLEVEAPTYDWLHRFRQSLDDGALAAWKHGRRASVADATPKLTVPADLPHEVWTLDEKQAPVWIRAYHPDDHEYVAVKPQIILIIDNYSRAIVAYRVVPPFRTGATVSFNEEDVLGTILSAALPELARPATRPYAGFLPKHLRWDRHSTHRALSDRLDRHGIHVPEVPGAQPWSQGRVERLIQTMKQMCVDMKGWDQKWVPASEVNRPPGAKGSSAAASGTDRETAKMVAPTKELMGYREFVQAFDQRVEAYNTREHSVIDTEPDIRYHSGLEEGRARDGYDALYLLPDRAFNVTKKGIVHRRQRFAWESGGRTLRVGEKIEGKPDPLLRGIFVQLDGDRWDFLPRLEDYARKADHKKQTIEGNRRAKEASLEARRARQERLEDEIGPEGIAEAEAEMEASLEGESYGPNREPLPEDEVEELPEEGPPDPADEKPVQPEAAETDASEEDESTGEPEEGRGNGRPPGLRSPGDRIRKAE